MTQRVDAAPPAAAQCDADPASIPAAAAHRLIAAAAAPLPQIECVALRAALGRVTAGDIHSPQAVPNHTNSAMDGYAVHHGDLPHRDPAALRLIGTAMAGKPFAGSMGRGECVRIMTGAVMPAGSDSVVIQERVTVVGDSIRIPPGENPGANVRQAGEDIAAGAVAIPAGRRLQPPDLGLAASLGLAELPVRRRPRVAFFSNGDELRPLGSSLEIGQLHDSNRYTLYGMLARAGVEQVDLGIVPDDAAALREALSGALACADVVITSAGASVGEADYLHQLLGELATVHFHKVAIKPGRPTIFASAGHRLLFALPGNPVSVMVTFQLLVAPALRRLAGETATTPLRLRAKTISALQKRPGRTEYQRGVLHSAADGDATVQTTGNQGSGILRSMGDANCFILLPPDSSGVAAGEWVEVQPFAVG